MSRVGKAPILVGDNVQVQITPDNEVIVKGQKASQSVQLRPNVTAKFENGVITVTRNDDSKESRSLHGLYRALIQNAVTGVSQGFEKKLELNGVGYRASVSGKTLEMSLGYSHPIKFDIPEGIEIKVEKQTSISVLGASKELVGQVAAKLRSYRPPEPYLGKGVKYADETIRRKAGKSAGK